MQTGKIVIELTSVRLLDQIAEARDRLDRCLKKFNQPPVGQVQFLRLVKIYPLTYELALRPQATTEPRTIL